MLIMAPSYSLFQKKKMILIGWFWNRRKANIEELTRTGGNVEAAVDRLLNRPR